MNIIRLLTAASMALCLFLLLSACGDSGEDLADAEIQAESITVRRESASEIALSVMTKKQTDPPQTSSVKLTEASETAKAQTTSCKETTTGVQTTSTSSATSTTGTSTSTGLAAATVQTFSETTTVRTTTAATATTTTALPVTTVTTAAPVTEAPVTTYDRSRLFQPNKQPLDYDLPYEYSIAKDGSAHFLRNGSEIFVLSKSEYVLLCNVVVHEYGEASYVPTYERSLVVEVIMNRFIHWGYDSLYDTVTDGNAFAGSAEYADSEELYATAGENVRNAVAMYFCNLDNPDYYNEGYYFFTGDGRWNHFRAVWRP